ncbi:hypothetical protein D3C86_2262210 [compost metagenome]
MFCDAIVTMNSGSAMLIIAGAVKDGITNSGRGTSAEDSSVKASAGISTPKAMTSTKASRAAGTA